jgi:hypothetical protein
LLVLDAVKKSRNQTGTGFEIWKLELELGLKSGNWN